MLNQSKCYVLPNEILFKTVHVVSKKNSKDLEVCQKKKKKKNLLSIVKYVH